MSKNITKILHPAARLRSGAKVPHHKNTAEADSIVMPPPKEVKIAMLQHIGAPCVPTVKVGDSVCVGQLIGDSDRPVSAPIHSSVSGTVTAITKMELANGEMCDAVVIASDGLMTPCESIAPPTVETREQLVAAVRASGLVGLGGAGFPASVKLSTTADIDTLIINGAECEPYITADYRECIENYADVMEGVYTVGRLLGVKQVIICIESNKPRALALLAAIAAQDDSHGDMCKVMKLPSRYPQGAEKTIIYSATGRTVPAGKLPSDVGCVVMNITSISFLMRYLRTGMPLTTKRITVDGTAVGKPCNLIVPIGTPLTEVLNFCQAGQASEVLMGGPMMGIDVCDRTTSVLKQTNAVLAFTAPMLSAPSTACIRCTRCISHCPMHLMPVAVEQALKTGDDSRLQKLGVMTCMECGCCSFGCPAHRPLTQSMKLAKQKVRNMK